jgi:ubiquinone/menaquinone biosynthesis C-methylase UbiE
MISSRRRTGGGSEEIRSAFSIFVASIDELPYGDGIFDAVISSLMFHHLPLRIKKRGLEEVYRASHRLSNAYLDFIDPISVIREAAGPL